MEEQIKNVISKPFVYTCELTRILMLTLENDIHCREIETYFIDKRKSGKPLHVVLKEYIDFISKNGVNIVIERYTFHDDKQPFQTVDLSKGFDHNENCLEHLTNTVLQ